MKISQALDHLAANDYSQDVDTSRFDNDCQIALASGFNSIVDSLTPSQEIGYQMVVAYLIFNNG